MIYIGIDPGVSGGIAMLGDGGTVLLALPMPETDQDLLTMLHEGFVTGAVEGLTRKPAHAVLERVHSGVFRLGGRMGVVSAMTFGRNVGAVQMALAAAKIPYDQVVPQKWQQFMGCLSHGDKNITKRRAQQLFPNRKVTHAIADALLIAEYCRRIRTAAGVPVHG